jgi:predicted nucleic acid-binding protein
LAVIDASTVIAAVSPDERAEDAYSTLRKALSQRPHAPALLLYECANIFQVKYRRKIFNQATRDELIDIVIAFGIALIPPDPTRFQVFTVPLAALHGLSVYDATYLDLARERGEPLATQDRRLRDAARAEGVILLG